jgi:UDP-N-acetylmuramoyl-L-alanyl-D-glutamate--2,6-diaminopimelate ligase
VINADSPQSGLLVGLSLNRGHRVLTYGVNGTDIRLIDTVPRAQGQDIALVVADRPYQLHLPLAGQFQAANALCALGLALATGAPKDAAVAALEHLEGVPGRLQKVAETPSGAAVYVDYAHTPDALETVLAALRPHAVKRLVVVFGCGGDRDPGKRPQMGQIAARSADLVFITDDNPRSEDPASIRAQILAACPGATEIGDRGEAIGQAVGQLGAGDLLVIAGKGHETGQIVGDKTLPFDDAVVVRQAVGSLP